MQINYSSLAQKQQSGPSQTLVSEDQYLELIRSTDFGKNSQVASSQIPFGYVTASPFTAAEITYEYSTKAPLSRNEIKIYTSQTHVPSTPSSPVPHLQPQNSRQQFLRQPPHYLTHPAQYVTVASSHDIGSSFNEDIVRVNFKKKEHRTKYDPSKGQYPQKVTAKLIKKVVNFKPSYQYTSTIQTQSTPSNQREVSQTQPLHYQSVQQITQTENTKSGSQSAKPQSQYSIVVPQSNIQAQHVYYPTQAKPPSQYVPHNERLVANNYEQSGLEQANLLNVPQQADNKPKEHSDFRAQYFHHVSPTATPTSTSRTRFVSGSTFKPLKFEIYNSNGNGNGASENGHGNGNGAKEALPKIKLVTASQNLHRPQYADSPQYYKKIKIQPTAHVHYVPVRAQYHQPTAQPSQASPQSDLLIPIQPSRSTLLVAPNTGKSTFIL